MQGPAWVALFRQIPPNLHETLAVLTNTGAEIVIQRIMCLEEEFIVLRGRMAGTMDGGRVVILPYNQISNVAINRRMTEPEVQAIFGKDHSVQAAATSAAQAPAIAANEGRAELGTEVLQESLADMPIEELPADKVMSEESAAVAQSGAQPSSHPSKSILLARLRARLSGSK